jgi:CBS domain-containing protein
LAQPPPRFQGLQRIAEMIVGLPLTAEPAVSRTRHTADLVAHARRVQNPYVEPGSKAMHNASDILRDKGHRVWSVKPTNTVLEALGVLAKHDIGAVLVLDGDKLVGIFSERDYARKVVLAGRSSKDSRVDEVMTSQVVCVSPERSIDECMALMTNRRLRHLPVVDHKRVIGIVSIGDLVNATIDDQQFTITQLQSYIAGAA